MVTSSIKDYLIKCSLIYFQWWNIFISFHFKVLAIFILQDVAEIYVIIGYFLFIPNTHILTFLITINFGYTFSKNLTFSLQFSHMPSKTDIFSITYAITSPLREQHPSFKTHISSDHLPSCFSLSASVLLSWLKNRFQSQLKVWQYFRPFPRIYWVLYEYSQWLEFPENLWSLRLEKKPSTNQTRALSKSPSNWGNS